MIIPGRKSPPPLSLRPDAALAFHGRQLRQKSFGVIAAALSTVAGSRRELMTDGTAVVKGEKLTSEMLEALFTNRAAAIHIPKFCAASVCDKIASMVLEQYEFRDLQSEATNGETKTDMYFGVGLQCGVLWETEELRHRYFNEALPSMWSFRKALEGAGIGPTDKLRLELDELWKHGAVILSHPFYRRKMLAGIGRLMRPSGMLEGLSDEGMVHMDTMPPLSPRKGQFSANVYMTVPKSGGELVIYNLACSPLDYIRDYDFYQLFRHTFDVDKMADVQKKVRARLPAPIIIKPEQGDLVLFNSGRPHAVRAFHEPYRMTFQTFIQYDASKPLRFNA